MPFITSLNDYINEYNEKLSANLGNAQEEVRIKGSSIGQSLSPHIET